MKDIVLTPIMFTGGTHSAGLEIAATTMCHTDECPVQVPKGRIASE